MNGFPDGPTTPLQDPRHALPADVRARLHTITHQHLERLALFALLYAVGASLAVVGHRHGMAWPFLLPLYLLAAAALHGISLFTHEGVHHTLSRRSAVNQWLAAACAWPVLQNFAAYRVLHLRHHAHLGLAGDPDHYPNYTSWTWMERALYWGRLLAGYPVYVTAIPFLGARVGTPQDRRFILTESLLMLLLVGGAWWALPTDAMVHGWLIPMVLINTMVNVRGMSQHTLLKNPAHPVEGSRIILGNRLTRFFMCNENFHLEHHLFPGVPWYHLPALHLALRPHLAAAPVIRSYRQFVLEFITASLGRVPSGTVTPKP